MLVLNLKFIVITINLQNQEDKALKTSTKNILITSIFTLICTLLKTEQISYDQHQYQKQEQNTTIYINGSAYYDEHSSNHTLTITQDNKENKYLLMKCVQPYETDYGYYSSNGNNKDGSGVDKLYLKITQDKNISKIIEKQYDELPTHYSIDVNGTKQLIFDSMGKLATMWGSYYGLANMYLYK